MKISYLVLIILLVIDLNNSSATPKEVLKEIRNELSHLKEKFSESSHKDRILILKTINRRIDSCKTETNSLNKCLLKCLKADLLNTIKDYNRSISLAHQAHKLAIKLKLRKEENRSLIIIAMNHIGLSQTNEAEKYLSIGLKKNRLLKHAKYSRTFLEGFSILELVRGNYESVISYSKEALNLYTLDNNIKEQAFARNFMNIGSAFYNLRKLDSAKKYIDKAVKLIPKNSKYWESRVTKLIVLGKVNLKLGLAQESQKQFNEALELTQENGSLSRLQEVKYYYSTVLYELKQYKEAYKLLKNSIELYHDLKKTQSDSVALDLDRKYKIAEKEVENATLKVEKLRAESKNQKMAFAVISILIISILSFLSYYYYNRNKQYKQERLIANMQSNERELKLIALRTQMNPHFVFNCISTAQGIISKGQQNKGFQYLGKLARLQKKVLEQTDSFLIPLEEELETLTIYLELESARFDHTFAYDIKIDHELKNTPYDIPSMILQPFVENSIKHGLMNKPTQDGKLTISFRLIKDQLTVNILDNGIGREQSTKLNEQKGISGLSLATQNIERRLELIESKYERKATFRIIDLLEEEKPIGTNVILNLPLI